MLITPTIRRLLRLNNWLRWRNRRSLARKGTFIADSVQVLGWANISIGRNCVISDESWINVNERSPHSVSIRIGDFTFLGRRNFLSSGALIDIGPYCLTGIDCHFLGADHNYSDPFVPYVTTGVTKGGQIRIGANCWLGSSVTILKGVTVGHGSVVGAASVVTQDIPPFSIAVGSPARIVKRFDPVLCEWIRPELLPESRFLPTEDEYIEKLQKHFPAVRLPAIAGSRKLGDI